MPALWPCLSGTYCDLAKETNVMRMKNRDLALIGALNILVANIAIVPAAEPPLIRWNEAGQSRSLIPGLEDQTDYLAVENRNKLRKCYG